jgi:hypothetical protein
LKEFGIHNSRTQFVVFFFDATEAHISRIRELVEGEAISISSEAFSALKNESMIIKHYKIEEAERALGSLDSAVINRIALRDI